MDIIARCRELIAQKGSVPEAERLHLLFEDEWRWTMQESPELATMVGFPGRNDRWTDATPEAIARKKAGTRAVAEAVATFDRSQLGPQDALNLDLFARHAEEGVDSTRFPEEYLVIGQMWGPQLSLAQVLEFVPSSATDDLEDVVTRLDRAPALIEQLQALMEAGLAAGITPPRPVMDGVAEQIESHLVDDPALSPLMTPFRRVPDSIPADTVERFRREAGEIVLGKIVPVYRRLLEYFTGTYRPGCRESIALTDLPDGEEWYAFYARKFTTTTLTPKEIHEIGLGEVSRIRGRMEDVIRSTGFEGTFDAFLEFLRTDARFFFERPEDLLAAYRDIAKRADPHLIELFSTLPRLPYGVVPVPPYEEERAPTAYYRPGSLEAGRAGVFFANTSNLGARPKWEMEALTLHEAVPGHHLQLSLAQEQPDAPEFRKHGHFTAFVEGWGLYAESLGEEMGFYADPYSRFGQLTYEMWRAIRLVVDTGMHALGWSRDRAISFFVENAGKAEHDIIVEVDRYIAWPGQALAYKIGELKLKELRARATSALGDRLDLRRFHDVLLEVGALPLDVLERRVDDWIAAQRI